MQQNCCSTGALYEVLPLRPHVMFVNKMIFTVIPAILRQGEWTPAQTHSTDSCTQHKGTHLHMVGTYVHCASLLFYREERSIRLPSFEDISTAMTRFLDRFVRRFAHQNMWSSLKCWIHEPAGTLASSSEGHFFFLSSLPSFWSPSPMVQS